MRESWPNGPMYEPTTSYQRDVDFLLARLLEVPRPAAGEQLTIPEGEHHVQWNVENDLYWIEYGSIDEEGPQDDVVRLMRLGATADAMYHLRTYRYSRASGRMHVVDEAVAPEDIKVVRNRLAPDGTRREALEEMIEQDLFTASPDDYLDFLEDLASFRTSARS